MTPPTSVADAAPAAPAERGATATFHPFSFLLGLLTALTLVGGTLWLTRRPEPPPIAIQPPPTPAPTATPQPSPTPAPITVFVSGAVAQPGLYQVAAAARVGEVLALAGGLTDLADAVAVNQAEHLWDGAQIHVPSHQANGAETTVGNVEPPAGVSGSAAPAQRSTGIELTGGAAAGLIDLNLATAAELETLPGIGPSKAAAIQANRPYATIDDLTRVPGIGEKTVDQLRAYVMVE